MAIRDDVGLKEMSGYIATLSYSFNPANRTINFGSQPGFDQRYLKGVLNLTQATTMYVMGGQNMGLSPLTGTFDSTGQVLTLALNTTSYGVDDILVFLYDDQGRALGDIRDLLANTVTDATQLSKGVGAAVYSPSMEDLLLILIAEQRATRFVLSQMAGMPSLDTLVDGYLQELKS